MGIIKQSFELLSTIENVNHMKKRVYVSIPTFNGKSFRDQRLVITLPRAILETVNLNM